MIVKSLRSLLFFAFLFSLVLHQAQARQGEGNVGTMGEISLRGRIVEVNEEHRFVVINLGSADGVKEGMLFSVFQKDEEAAKIKASKVRRHISACDIQLAYTGRGIGAGDLVIYKEPSPLLKMLKPLQSTRMIEVEPIVVDIDAPKRKILQETLKAFKEFGALVTELSTRDYSLKANKNVPMDLAVGLFTEGGPFVKDKVYYTAEVIATPSYNRLVIRLRGVYNCEGQVYNHEIKKSSPVYKEAQEIAFTVKDLAQEL